jgi:hypothetical protein
VAETHHIYLIPGFFGFVNFGRLVYFSHVREYLDDAFGKRGVMVEIHRARTSPTASLRQRASQLAALIAETSPRGPIHLIGHSVGGLDARLFATPGVTLDAPVEDLAARVRTIVSVATPHHGTPLASAFTGLLGGKLLALLSVATVTVLRQGRLPLSVLTRVGAMLSRIAVPGSRIEAILAHLEDELVGRLPDGDRDQVQAFVAEMRDTALLAQLTPEGIDLFAAACGPRPGVRMGSVVARARPPGWRGQIRAGGPGGQVSYLVYRLLHAQVASRGWRPPELEGAQVHALAAGFGGLPDAGDSDGVVPTLSQVHGEEIAPAWADHLDVIGHFPEERHVPPHHDWIASGSRFDRRGFERLWDAVVDFVEPRRDTRPPWAPRG